MTRLDKILYLTLGLALAAVLELDGTFMANMRRAIGPIDDINPWVAGLGGAFAAAAVLALVWEKRR